MDDSNEYQSGKISRNPRTVRQHAMGNVLTIVLGEYDNREAAFLLQNMFPILPHYLDHIHTRNGNPVPVKYSVQQEVKSRVKQIRKLTERGIQVVFPDIVRLES